MMRLIMATIPYFLSERCAFPLLTYDHVSKGIIYSNRVHFLQGYFDQIEGIL